MTEHDAFKSFIPFQRNLQMPCILFAKWDNCGHCHSLAPEMRKAQVTLKKVMPVYKVDAERNDRVTDQLGITGFPEVFVVDKNRRLHKYNGARKAESIVKFARQYK